CRAGSGERSAWPPIATEDRRAVEGRLWRENRRARSVADAGVACAVGAAAAWFAALILLSDVVDRVFLRGGTTANVRVAVVLTVGLVAVRAGLIWGGDGGGETAA